MPTATLLREVERLRATVGQQEGDNPTLEAVRQDPANLMGRAGMTPDRWQAELLRSTAPRSLVLCGRQCGKSQAAGALALREAFLRPRSLVLLLSPSLRQSSELFRDKVLPLYNALGRPVPSASPRDSALQLCLANGSRIISLPGCEGSIRGFSSVRLLVIDEAARVPDDLYRTVRPMLAVSGGALVCLSTPFGKLGWFFDAWHGVEPWRRVRVPAANCQRIAPAFLQEERRALGQRWYAQEYECEFSDMMGALFSSEDIRAAMDDDLRPLFAEA